ncbi:hypothetical protein, partial [Escherichia coli]|uniref:hypothetical protein n=1 Tax=Escherichia coli TaxID=562 RepID=UPI001BECB7E3
IRYLIFESFKLGHGYILCKNRVAQRDFTTERISMMRSPIYHNIRYQHPLTGPQRNSGASEPFPAHFLTRIPEKRPR